MISSSTGSWVTYNKISTFHASEFYCSEAASTEHDVCLLYTMQCGATYIGKTLWNTSRGLVYSLRSTMNKIDVACIIFRVVFPTLPL